VSFAGRVRQGRLRFMLCVPIVAVLALSGGNAYTRSEVQPLNDLPNPYQTIENYFKMTEGRTWGSTSAVDIDRDGRSIWVAERCGANSCAASSLPPILKFDQTGRLVRSFGAGMFIFPHGMHVDRDGNVWVTDAKGPDGKDKHRDGKGHQVIKFSSEGEVLLTLGKAGVAGDGSGELLNEPNDVVTASNGDIFVADGHSGQNQNAPPNTVARIAKFSRDGKFVKTWGKLGSAPGEFRTPHGLAFDSRGRLFVADRGNDRIQVFDQDGKFLHEWKQFSRLSGIYIDGNDILYGTDSESSATLNPGWKQGIRIGSVRDGKVMYFIPGSRRMLTGTRAPEGVAADAQGNVYGAEVGLRALKKYVKKHKP
jgi:sugar lactone lactonase YvrE